MKTKFIYLYILLATLLLTTGCHKEPATTTATALFGLHMHTYIADSLIAPGNLGVYIQDSAGRVEQLYHAQFYVSNISLHSTTTNLWYTMPNTYFLKREENEEYALGTVPADNYDDVRFTVGLSSVVNSGSPTTYTAAGVDTVLSSIESSMYFGNGLGYKFISVAGVVDTTYNNSGTHLIPFSYDLGATGDTVNFTFPTQSFTLQPSANVGGTVQYVHIICDYGHLLQNVPIVGNASARTVNSNGTNHNAAGNIATQIWNNIVGMFRYECSTPNGNC